MIELSTTAAIILYLSLTIIVIFGFWVASLVRSRQKKIDLIEKRLLVCEYCQCAYLETVEKSVTQCPQCQSFNENNPFIATD